MQVVEKKKNLNCENALSLISGYFLLWIYGARFLTHRNMTRLIPVVLLDVMRIGVVGSSAMGDKKLLLYTIIFECYSFTPPVELIRAYPILTWPFGRG